MIYIYYIFVMFSRAGSVAFSTMIGNMNKIEIFIIVTNNLVENLEKTLLVWLTFQNYYN